MIVAIQGIEFFSSRYFYSSSKIINIKSERS